MKRLLGLLLVFALVFAVTAAGENDKKESDNNQKAPEKAKEINWVRYDEGLKTAKAAGKHVLVNFTTAWCGYCKKMNATTFKEPDIIDMLTDNFVAIKVDGDSKQELDIDGYKITERDLSRAEYRVQGYPAYWFLKPNGERLGVLPGYQEAGTFMDVLYFMKEALYDKMSFEDYIKNGGRKAFAKK
ncbi:MAG: hypothetical protein CVT49_13325 [candidate division Zixibacteria bacterium HGW-Zixibacteria-1]|nr:MAG: hypothetical protein CVT49_13325 [candidate division Zixibacteria bacterium HGW-Zixibacteria-1]